MEWIPIDIDKLPVGEVLAANFQVNSCGYREKLVGYIGIELDGVVTCDSDDTTLENVTHYIDIHKFDI